MSDHSPQLAGARRAWSEFVHGGIEPEPRWYAVQCLSHRESMASAHLQNQNLRVFLPRRQKTRRHARKIDVVLAPFFPGYLFVQLDLTRDQWRSVNGTYGVGHLVMQGDAPAPAPRGVVEALRDTCDENSVLRLPSDELKPGQSVRILTGAFADFVGEIDRLDDAGRVRVLLDIMGGGIPVVLPKGSVVPASSSL
jgi:transcription elongation factor/antiterminator RfaH